MELVSPTFRLEQFQRYVFSFTLACRVVVTVADSVDAANHRQRVI
jgi:hypothetical protein